MQQQLFIIITVTMVAMTIASIGVWCMRKLRREREQRRLQERDQRLRDEANALQYATEPVLEP